MTDQPTPPDDTRTSDQPAPSEEAPPRARTRFRDTVLGFRGIVAVGTAGLVLGGAAGTAIGFAADDDGHDRRPARFGAQVPDHDQDGVQPPGMQGPPSTAPDDDVQPDGSADESGSTNS
jgi:hypothetical protein